MKNLKQIRETYDYITEKSEKDQRNLDALVEAGLFEEKKLPVLKRILESSADKMTGSEKRFVVNLLESIITQYVTEAKNNPDYLAKYDKRGPKDWPSDSDLPPVLILKRKAIRVYPDNTKVALYYAQAIDRYVSVPYGGKGHIMAVNEAVSDDDKKRPVPTTKKLDPIATRKDLTAKDLPAIRSYLMKQTLTSNSPVRDAMINLGAYAGMRYRLKKAAKIKQPTEKKEPYFKDIPRKPPTPPAAQKTLPSSNQAPSPFASQAAGVWSQRRLKESFEDKLLYLKEKAARKVSPDEGGTEGVRTFDFGRGGGDIMPRGGAFEYGKQRPEVGMPANNNVLNFGGLRGKTIKPKISLSKRKNPFYKGPQGAGVNTGVQPKTTDVWGADTSKDKVTGDMADFLKKRESEKNRKSDEERTRRYQTKQDAIKQAKKGFGTTGAVGNPPATKTAETPVVEPPAKKMAMPNVRTANKPEKMFLKPPVDPNTGATTITSMPPVNLAPPKAAQKQGTATDQAPSRSTKQADAEDKAAQQQQQQQPNAKQNQKRDQKKDDKQRPRNPRRRFRLPDISLPSSPPGPKEPGPNYAFGLKPSISTPQAVSNRAAVDRWMDIINRKANQAMLRENTPERRDDDEEVGTAGTTQDGKPVYNFRKKPRVGSSKASSASGAVERWMERIARQANQAMLRQQDQQNESVYGTIENMVENNIAESQIVFGEQSITINNTVARKLVSIHEAMNKKNKKKMEEMLNESASSFQKVLTFAVRH